MARNVEFKSIREVDLTVLEAPQVAVYDSPKDYPGKYVGRVLDNAKPTNMIIVSDNLNKLFKDIRDNTSLFWFWRGKDDVPALVGVFL